MNKLIAISTLGLMLSASPYAMANSHDEVEALQEQVRQLTATLQSMNQKLNTLEAGQAENKKAVAKKSKLGSWTERTKIKGDLRYRYENTDREVDNGTNNDTRERQRVRARVSIFSKINDTVDVEVGIASGGSGAGTATSTNQSFDDGFTTKGIGLDLAYFDWHPVDGVKVIGGKMKNPFYRPAKTGLIWDGDLRPEGLAVKYDGGLIFANAGAFYLEEDRDDSQESFLFGSQLGAKLKVAGTKLTAGIGYFQFDGIKNDANGDIAFGDNTQFNGAFENDFEIVELFGKLDFKVAGMKASIFADYANNTGTDDQANNGDNDEAWLAGFEVKPGAFSFKYFYAEIENDAVLAAFNDSDFAEGGTDAEGHVFKLGYKIDKNWKLGLTYFNTDDDGLLNNAQSQDLDTLQADIKFKF